MLDGLRRNTHRRGVVLRREKLDGSDVYPITQREIPVRHEQDDRARELPAPEEFHLLTEGDNVLIKY